MNELFPTKPETEQLKDELKVLKPYRKIKPMVGLRPDKSTVSLANFPTAAMPDLPLLPFGQQVGPLRVGGVDPVELSKTKFTATCDCGNTVILTAEKIAARVKYGIGCGRLSCSHTSFKTAVKHCAEAAIEAQLNFLICFMPEMLQSFWGGTDDDAFDVDPNMALSNLLQFVEPYIDYTKGAWWINRVNKSLPFCESNLAIGTCPSRIFRRSKFFYEVGGSSFSIEELALLNKQSIDYVIELIIKNPDREFEVDDFSTSLEAI